MGRKRKELIIKERFFKILVLFGFTDVTSMIHPEYGYTTDALADYSSDIKRAFKKGTYMINCDYEYTWISIGEYRPSIFYSELNDKLIALAIYLASLKRENSRYKFGKYLDKGFDNAEVYDAIMTSYPYSQMNKDRKEAIERARLELPQILDKVESFK